MFHSITCWDIILENGKTATIQTARIVTFINTLVLPIVPAPRYVSLLHLLYQRHLISLLFSVIRFRSAGITAPLWIFFSLSATTAVRRTIVINGHAYHELSDPTHSSSSLSSLSYLKSSLLLGNFGRCPPLRTHCFQVLSRLITKLEGLFMHVSLLSSMAPFFVLRFRHFSQNFVYQYLSSKLDTSCTILLYLASGKSQYPLYSFSPDNCSMEIGMEQCTHFQCRVHQEACKEEKTRAKCCWQRRLYRLYSWLCANIAAQTWPNTILVDMGSQPGI